MSRIDPPPMPNIRPALIFVDDIKIAAVRAGNAWNSEQLKGALKSIKKFVSLAEKAMGEKKCQD